MVSRLCDSIGGLQEMGTSYPSLTSWGCSPSERWPPSKTALETWTPTRNIPKPDSEPGQELQGQKLKLKAKEKLSGDDQASFVSFAEWVELRIQIMEEAKGQLGWKKNLKDHKGKGMEFIVEVLILVPNKQNSLLTHVHKNTHLGCAKSFKSYLYRR